MYSLNCFTTEKEIKLAEKLETAEYKSYNIQQLYNITTEKCLNKKYLSNYEIIDGKCKGYIDIEKIVEIKDRKIEREQLINEIKEKLNNEDFILLDGSRKYKMGNNELKHKLSFHIIFTKYHFDSGIHVKEFVEKFNLPIDKSVYKKYELIQKFRMPYCVKRLNEKNPLKKVNMENLKLKPFKNINIEDFSKMLITNIENTEYKKVEILEKVKTKKVNLSKTKQKEPQDNKDYYYKNLTKEQLENLINCIESKEDCSREEWIKTIWCIRNIADHYNVDLKDIAHKISMRLGEYDEIATDEAYDKSNGKGLTLGSMLYWIPEDKKEEWKLSIDNERNFESSDVNLARLFKKYFGKDYLFIITDKSKGTGDFYYFNGIYWEHDVGRHLIYKALSEDLYYLCRKKVQNIINFEEEEKIIKQWQLTKSHLIYLHKESGLKQIAKSLERKLKKDIKFDQNPMIIVFKNGIYDFEKMEFRNSNREEYISNTLNTGYDYYEIEDEKNEMKNFESNYINKIFINDEDDKNAFMKLISSSLLGERIKNFGIANGFGNNGKTVFIELLTKMLGDYACKINSETILKGNKIDQFAVNNINKKRLVYCEEPDEERTINGNFLKDLTGGSTAVFRKIFTGSPDIGIHCLVMILCNKKPAIKPCDEAIRNRLIDFPFKSTFTHEEIDNITRFAIDKKYESDKWLHDNKMKLFFYLLDYLKMFLEDKKNIILTKKLAKRRDQYLLDSDEIYQWFDENYKILDLPKEKYCSIKKIKYVKMKDVVAKFKSSQFFQDLSKKDKRIYTKKKIEEELLSRKPIGKRYKNEYIKKIKKQTLKIKNILLEIEIRKEEDEDDEVNDEKEDPDECFDNIAEEFDKI